MVYVENEKNEIMDISLKSAEILLKSGAEIFRVEYTVKQICKSFGAECESFVLPTGIFISVKVKGANEPLTSFK